MSLHGHWQALYTPTADFMVDDQFSRTVCDGTGGESTAVVRLRVNPVSDAPTLASAADQAVAEGGLLTLDLQAQDVDDPALRDTLLQGDYRRHAGCDWPARCQRQACASCPVWGR